MHDNDDNDDNDDIDDNDDNDVNANDADGDADGGILPFMFIYVQMLAFVVKSR
jgi:hypothetical protein